MLVLDRKKIEKLSMGYEKIMKYRNSIRNNWFKC